MNILLINQYAGVHGMEYRPFYLAREWVLAGHNVRIVAASQSHVRAKLPKMERQTRIDQFISGITYTWLAVPRYRKNGTGRLLNIMAFLAHLRLVAESLVREQRPDIVIASSTYPLDIWPARAIASRADARLVFEVHDLWPLRQIELGKMSRHHPLIVLLQAAENYACRHSDKVISMLPNARAYLEKHGMAPHKFRHIPDGIDPDAWGSVRSTGFGITHSRLESLGRNGRLLIGYAGSHGIVNALEVLLDVAHLFRNAPLDFVLVGDGPEKLSLMAAARLAALHNVRFLDPVPKCDVPALLARFDIAYIGWRRHSLHRVGTSSNKLVDYMMARCPIVHAVASNNDPVKDAGCGFSVAPGDPKAIANAITALYEMGPEARAQMGQRGQRYALQHLSYRVLASAYLQACTANRTI